MFALAVGLPDTPVNLPNCRGGVRHGRTIEIVGQLEVAAAEKMVWLYRGRPAKSASHNAHSTFRAIGARAEKLSLPLLDHGEKVIGMLGDHLEDIARRQLRQIEFVAVFALNGLKIKQPVFHK